MHVVPPLQLQAPLRLDIRLRDILRALAANPPKEQGRVPVGGTIHYSVRTAWDLFLQAIDKNPGDQVILSAMTIPHMEVLIRAHGLEPVPVAPDPDTLLPNLDVLEAARTPRTRGVLIAHLFGSWSSLDSVAKWCLENDLWLVEDCAQSFMGADFQGTAQAAATFFSFGTIKRSTAFGGCVAFVRGPRLAQTMAEIEASYPIQTSWSYSRKLLKYGLLGRLLTPPLYSFVVQGIEFVSRQDHHEVLRQSVRGFAQGEIPAVFRRRPCAELCRLVSARWHGTSQSVWQKRSVSMWALLDRCGIRRDSVPGHAAAIHTFWLLPFLTAEPASIVSEARRLGLDASQGLTSLRLFIDRTGSIPHPLERLVYLPVHPTRILPIGPAIARALEAEHWSGPKASRCPSAAAIRADGPETLRDAGRSSC